MRILITNDDGISADGIRRLAQMAASFGEVWVVAPENQCSAMSHRITIRDPLMVRRVDYPVPVAAACPLGGTPADCVKVALSYLMRDCRMWYSPGGITDTIQAMTSPIPAPSERRWRP